MEVTLDLAFKEEYNDPSSAEYKALESNLTISLEKTYQNVDGFVGIRILYIRKGSVVCSYIVILAKDAEVEKDKLKKVLDEASKEKKFGFTVKSIKVEEEPTYGGTGKREEKLPEWALVTMIVLGCLAFIFLVIVICVCVKYRRAVSGENDAYYVSTGELGMHTYETVPMADSKVRGNPDGKYSTAQRRIIGSHNNPTYGSNGALAD